MIPPEQDAPTDFEPSDFIGSFLRTVKGVFLVPGFFYERMTTQGGLRNPFIFLICCTLIHTLVVSLFREQTIVAFHAVNEILMPFFMAGVLFFIITRLFKASGTYEMAFRVNAYASATALVSWIPMVGLVVQFYHFYLIAVGLNRVFSIRASQAFLSIIIAIIIYIFALGPIMTQIIGGQWITTGP